MQSEDLARPVIIITSLLDNKDLYEIYSYSDNVVVMPLDEAKKKEAQSPIYLAAAKALHMKIQTLINCKCDVQVTGPTEIMLTVPDREAGRIIGK
jgi:ATPase